MGQPSIHLSVLIILSNLLGFIAVVKILAWLRSPDGPADGWKARLWSYQGLGVLVLLAAVGVLLAAGQYVPLRLLAAKAAQAEWLAQFNAAVQRTLDKLPLEVQGGDPFQDRRETSILRIRGVTKAGSAFTSEVTGARLEAPESGAEKVHLLPWQQVVQGVAEPEEKAFAARLSFINDLRQIRSLELTVVEWDDAAPDMPQSLGISADEQGVVPVFRGTRASPEPQRTGDHWETVYRDEQSPAAWLDGAVVVQPLTWESVNASVENLFTTGIALLGVGLLLLLSRPEWESFTRTLSPPIGQLLPFAVFGLALLLLMGGVHLSVGEDRLKWVLYVIAGSVFPVLVWAVFAPAALEKSGPGRVIAEMGLVAFCVVAYALYVINHFGWFSSVMAVVQWLGALAVTQSATSKAGYKTDGKRNSGGSGWVAGAVRRLGGKHPALSLLGLLVSLIAWQVAVSAWPLYMPWDSLKAWALNSPAAFVEFLLCLGLVVVNVGPWRRAWQLPWFDRWPVNLALNLIAAAILAMEFFSIRHVWAEPVVYFQPYLHWDCFVGPAEQVRQGGWLLWDVPSMYGFLSIASLVLFPAKSAWQSLYLVNASCLFLSALFLYFLLRSLRPGIANWCFALLLTTAVTFGQPGYTFSLSGPQVFPSVGAFRFMWVFALLAVLVLHLHLGAGTKRGRLALYAGCVVWVIGTLWSSESAVYCGVIWVPAYAAATFLGAADPGRRHRASPARTWGIVAARLLFPPALLLLTVGAVSAYYLAHLGHAPEWHGYFEYGVELQKTAFAGPMLLDGPVLVLLLVLCVLAAAGIYYFRSDRVGEFSLVYGAWAAVWSTGSYWVAKGVYEPLSFYCLCPVFCTAMALLLHVWATRGLRCGGAVFIRLGFVPVLTVLLAGAYANTETVVARMRSITDEIPHQHGESFERLLPVMDGSLFGLLKSAGVKPDDPMVYLDGPARKAEPMPMWPAEAYESESIATPTRTWIPFKPWHLSWCLPDDRKAVYLDRFVGRARLSGFLLMKKGLRDDPSTAWLLEELSRTYTPTKVGENEQFELWRYEYRNPAAAGQGGD